MKIFLNSQGFISVRKHGVKIASVIDEKNEFYSNLKKSIKNYGLFVLICNDPEDVERNDESALFIAQAFERQLTKFKNVVVLDSRNASKAKEYLNKADFVFLCGGKIECQADFLKQIKFKENINNDCVIVGVSAGAMNLCRIAYNYPEDITELNNPRWIDGLGYFNKIIIPHFKRFCGNMYHPKGVNPLIKFYIPDSMCHEFLALKNGSYILLDENGATLYGKSYLIKDGKVTRICKNKDKTNLKGVSMGVFEWFNLKPVPEGMQIKQVYGVLFDDEGRTLIRIESFGDKKVGGLAGGKPEKTDKDIEDTLRRESIEEVNTTLKEIHYLGYQQVDEGNGMPVYAQIRMIALIDKIGPLQPDPDNGKTYDRILTTPENAIKLLNWSKAGGQMIRDAEHLAKIKFNFKKINKNEKYVWKNN